MRLIILVLFSLIGISPVFAGDSTRVFWLVYRNYDNGNSRTYLMQFDSNGKVRMAPQEILPSFRKAHGRPPAMSYRTPGTLNFYLSSQGLIRIVTDKTLTLYLLYASPGR